MMIPGQFDSVGFEGTTTSGGMATGLIAYGWASVLSRLAPTMNKPPAISAAAPAQPGPLRTELGGRCRNDCDEWQRK